MGELRNTLRIEQSIEELSALRGAFDGWIRNRGCADLRARHSSQLEAVNEVMQATCMALSDDLATIDRRGATGEIYERCRVADTRTLFVRRLWQTFRVRWDDHDDPDLKPTLAAAEEVVWSCWAGAFRTAGATPVPPAPLIYVDPEFSPRAALRTQPPRELRTLDDLLRHTLAVLPISFIGIPPLCVRRPWWLALLAHETGHHVEAELDVTATSRVTTVIVEAAREAGLDATAWQRWSRELFADAYGIACVGDAHRWAVEELELVSDDAMEDDVVVAYPPPRLRLAFNDALLAAPAHRDPDGVGFVAEKLMSAALVSGRTLGELAGLRRDWFAEQGAVSALQGTLGTPRPVVEQGLAIPRLVVAAGVRASRRIAEGQDETAQLAERTRLRDRLLDVLPRCGERGVRAEQAGDRRALAAVSQVSEDIARHLLRLA